MRVPKAYSLAVRQPDGTIKSQAWAFESLLERHPSLKIPLLRGLISLYEALRIGIKTLNLSVLWAYPEEAQDRPEWKDKLQSFMGTLLALLLGLGLFFFAPLWLTNHFFELQKSALGFNLAAGLFRITFFLIYLALLSLLPDAKRLFRYHGAEHKSIYAFEAGRPLTVAEASRFSRRHPRCGTSFLFLVLLVSILLFSILDGVRMLLYPGNELWIRLITHLAFLPIVAGVGYESLKFSARKRDWNWVRVLTAPGLWLQGLTTAEPDNSQVEVALTALKTAFGDRLEEYVGQEYVAEAIA